MYKVKYDIKCVDLESRFYNLITSRVKSFSTFHEANKYAKELKSGTHGDSQIVKLVGKPTIIVS